MIGGLLILLMCFWPAAHPSANELWLTVLDVGQGLAIVVETQNHVLIYDTGLRTGADQDSARSIILPYLQQRQLKIIDKMIISHGDNDHSGGADTLLKTITVKSVLTSVPHRFTPQILCERDQQWAWDGAVFKILSPEKGVPYQKNNSSCVLEINFHEHRFLLPGDIESPVEVSLISLLKPVAVLIAPHHGSRTSSSDNFLKTLHPKLIVVSSGYFNRYHLPHPSIIAKYQQTPTIVMDTAKTGAVTVKVHDNNTLTAENYRSEHLRFWQ